MQVPDGLPSPARQRALLVIILGIGLAVLDGSIVTLALPGIARDLQAPPAHAVWVVNGYQLAVLSLLLPLATLGDIIGYRRVYLGGLVLFTAASVACMFATSLPMLLAARTVQGLGAAGIMAVNTALVRLIFPARLLGRGVAMSSMVVATASVTGPSLAALVLSVAPWPWLFALNLPLGLAVLWLGRKALPPNPLPPAPGVRFSPVDVLLNIGMFGLVFLGADALGARAGHAALPAGWGLALLAAGVAIGVVYVRRQRGLAVPLFPLDLLRIPLFRLSMCTSIAAFASQTLAYVALPFLLLEGLGRSHLQAGLLITAWPLAIVVVAPIAGRLIGRVPGGLLGAIGLGVMALGLALLALLPAQPVDADIAWRMAICGLGFGLFQSPNNHTIVTSAPPQRAGAASGMLGTARLTGQSIGALLLAILLGFGTTTAQGAVYALALAAACAAVAALFSGLRLRHTPQARN